MTNLKTRVERLESKLLMDENDQIQAVIMFTWDASKNGQPMPITKFSRAGMGGENDINRNPKEDYKTFEKRAVKEARAGMMYERRYKNGQLLPCPAVTLIADGDIQT